MEAQNHFYGHSAAWAAYLGRSRPRHVAGLVQHGWTAVSPVATHFRDFPDVGDRTASVTRRCSSGRTSSRGWDPAAEDRATDAHRRPAALPGAAAGPLPSRATSADAVVLMPVHGIQTQRVRGDHRALAQALARCGGPCHRVPVCRPTPRTPTSSRPTGMPVTGSSCSATGWRPTSSGGCGRCWGARAGWCPTGCRRRCSTPRTSAPTSAVYGDALRIEGEERGSERAGPRAVARAARRARRSGRRSRGRSSAELGVRHVRDPGRARGPARVGRDPPWCPPPSTGPPRWPSERWSTCAARQRPRAPSPAPARGGRRATRRLSFAGVAAGGDQLPAASPCRAASRRPGTPREPIEVGRPGAVPG